MPSFRSVVVACATALLSGCMTITTAGALDPRFDGPGAGAGWGWSNPDDPRTGRGTGPRLLVDQFGRPVVDRYGKPVYVDAWGRQVGPSYGYGGGGGQQVFPGMPGGLFGGGGGGYGYDDDDPRSRLSKGQAAALDQGCVSRYEGNPKKLRRCLNGDPRLFEDALEDGCHIRYQNNAKKLGRCLKEARGGGFPW